MTTSTTLLLLLILQASPLRAKNVKSPTPPMGWNTYNSYNCNPSETIVKLNAQGLVDTGLKDLGYTIVTPDCGWMARNRDSSRRLQWNATKFPSGGKGLGTYLHSLGLKFGVYSGGGYHQCGSTDLPGSLGYEDIDAKTFADWGGDSLKYDNCYATSNTTMVDSDSAEAKSPSRFQKMASSLANVDRDFQFFVCQWGIGEDVGDWASKIGNTWRMSNDIYNAWRSIWRITNQVVPYHRSTGPGAFPDMDMLLVGLNVLSAEEERFHFSMWAINKSPLIIGAILDSKLSKTSLSILSNKEVIAINQDPLAKPTQLVRRFTEEEYDIWLGPLSNNSRVLALANWRNASQTISLNFTSLGIKEATARDVWATKNLGALSGVQKVALAPHQLALWVLSDVQAGPQPQSTGYHPAAQASRSASTTLTTCPTGTCLPAGMRVGNVGKGGSVTFSNVTASSAGRNLLGIDFVNYDYAFATAWDWGSNTRNASIAVNGGKAKRWAFPLGGQDWNEAGRLVIEVDGFKAGGDNQVVFQGVGDAWAPDLVGMELLE